MSTTWYVHNRLRFIHRYVLVPRAVVSIAYQSLQDYSLSTVKAFKMNSDERREARLCRGRERRAAECSEERETQLARCHVLYNNIQCGCVS